MSIVLYHHPYSRAANVVAMLEAVDAEYTLHHVDIQTNEQKADAILKMNPLGKIPILKDGDVVVTESAAIGLYLADRYAPGRMAPALDDPRRGAYLRWSFFPSAVIEPSALAEKFHWEFSPSHVGWGTFETMHDAMELAVTPGPYILGDMFSMAYIIFGGTLLYMFRVNTLDPRPALVEYATRVGEHPAFQRANAIHEKMRAG